MLANNGQNHIEVHHTQELKRGDGGNQYFQRINAAMYDMTVATDEKTNTDDSQKTRKEPKGGKHPTLREAVT